MSRVLYDFLTESFLFREDHLAEDFASFGLDELEEELQRYRNHVMASLDEVAAEINARNSLLSIFFDTLTRPGPIIDRLKQCAFYFDFVVVDDPLFALSRQPDPAARPPTELLGYKQPQVDRKQVASAARFMESLAPMVGADFLKFSPVSLDREPFEGVPFRVSGNLFFEDMPSELHPFFKDRVKVHSIPSLSSRSSSCLRYAASSSGEALSGNADPASAVVLPYPAVPGRLGFLPLQVGNLVGEGGLLRPQPVDPLLAG